MIVNPADWAWGLGGGLLIGLSAAFYLLFNGRVAGISGILGGILTREPTSMRIERLAFLAGLIGAPAVWALVNGAPEVSVEASTLMLIVAGFVVGYGARLGSGCTSGHGVCGLTRFSPRSAASVVTFLTFGAIAVTLSRHVIGGF